MKILVTGANGQLGREIMCQAHNSEHKFIFTDLCSGKVETSGGAVIIEKMDITDPGEVAEMLTPDVDVVINCAAYTDVNAAETEHEIAEKVNVSGTAVLAKAAAEADALLMHISTDYIFDGKANTPYTEEQVPAPLNFYGLTKLRAEQEILASGCRYMIFRASWMYSIHGNNFFLTMSELTAAKPEVKVVMDQIGTPTSAADLAFLIYNIIEEGKLDKTGIYNYSDEGVCSWYDFAKEINDLLGHSCRVVPCRTADYPTPACRPAYSVLDKTKVKDAFDIEIPHWKESLQLVVQEYMETYE